MTAQPSTNGNGDQKVTNAMIGAKLDRLDERIMEMLGRMDKLEIKQSTDHDEVTRLRTVSGTRDVANFIVALIAAAIAALFGPR